MSGPEIHYQTEQLWQAQCYAVQQAERHNRERMQAMKDDTIKDGMRVRFNVYADDGSIKATATGTVIGTHYVKPLNTTLVYVRRAGNAQYYTLNSRDVKPI